MIDRTCLCGCSLSFRCLPTSKSYFYSLGHAEFASSRHDEVGDLARDMLTKNRFTHSATLRQTMKSRKKFYSTNYTPQDIELELEGE